MLALFGIAKHCTCGIFLLDRARILAIALWSVSTRLNLACNVVVEKVHIIKEAPLEMPCKQTIGSVDSLHAIGIAIITELVVVNPTPRQRTNNIDIVRVDSMQGLGQKVLIVHGSVKVEELHGQV